MRIRCLIVLTAASVVGLPARPAAAEVKPGLEGVLHTLCAVAGIANHPKRAELTTVIADDRFESQESVLLAAFYAPHPATQGTRGKLTATARLFRVDGTEKALGILKGRQEAANVPLLISKTAEISLSEGDVIQWKFKLQGFPQLAGGCFNIAAGVGPSE